MAVAGSAGGDSLPSILCFQERTIGITAMEMDLKAMLDMQLRQGGWYEMIFYCL
jgi:hypothetical protein